MIAQNNQLESNTQRAPRYAYLSGFLLMVTMLFATAPNGFQYDLSTDTDALLEGNWLTRGQWGPVYLIAAYLVWRHRTAALQFIRQLNPFMLGLISLMLLSALWSPLPEVTIRRGGLMVAALLIGFSVHLAGWYPQRLIRLLYLAFGGILIASIIAALLFPSFGIHQTGDFVGLWRGIGGDKNQMAKLSAVSVVIGSHAFLTAPDKRGWHGLFLTLALLGLIMSGGKSSLVAALAAVFLMFTITRQPITNRFWLPVTAVSLFLLIAIPLHFYIIVNGVPTYSDIFGPFFELLGKDASLTGRDEIWVWVLPVFQQHWVLGYGYGAFWVGDFGLSGKIAASLGYYPWQSHNGFLEIANELGIVGLGLLIAFLVFHVRQLSILRHVNFRAFAFYAPLLVLLVATNISESGMFNGVNIYTLLLMFSSVAVSRLLWSAKEQAEQPSPTQEQSFTAQRSPQSP